MAYNALSLYSVESLYQASNQTFQMLYFRKQCLQNKTVFILAFLQSIPLLRFHSVKFFCCTHLHKTISGWRDHAFETFRVFCLHFERHPIWGLDWLCKQFHFLYKPIFDSSHHGLDSLAPFPRNFPQSLERQNPKPKVENIYLSFSGCLNNWLISRPICFWDLLTFDIKNFMNWIFAKLLSFFRSVCLVR